MEIPNETKNKIETPSSPPERGRAWRIVAVVLTLHAALLGSVVLIQGCSKSDNASLAEDDHLLKPSSAEQAVSQDPASPDANGFIVKLPSDGAMIPGEDSAGLETVTSSTVEKPGQNVMGADKINAIVANTEEQKLDTSVMDAAPKSESTPAPAARVETPKAMVKETPAPVPSPQVATESKPEKSVSTTTYVVRKGDTLSKIAKSRHVSVKDIVAANSLADVNNLKIGQKISIPSGGRSSIKTSTASTSIASSAPKTSNSSGKLTHVVKKGESPASIARRYGVTVQALMQSNHISDPRKVQVNQKLVIPSAQSEDKDTATTPAVSKKSPEVKPEMTEGPLGYVKEANA